MEDFPFREWLGRVSDFALLERFGDRMRMGFRSRRMDCPLGRGFAEGCPAEQTRRSAPPPSGCWVHSARCGEGRGLEFSIHAVWQPMGTVSVRSRPSGADTEVCPPATRVVVPLAALCGWTGIGNFRSRQFERMRGARQAPLRSCPACGGGCGGACCSRHRGRRPPAGAPPPENQTPSPPAPECPPAARSRTRSASRICCR